MTRALQNAVLCRWGGLIQADMESEGLRALVKHYHGGAEVPDGLKLEVRQMAEVEAHKLFQRGWRK